MELYALDGRGAVAYTHDLAIIALGGDLEASRQTRALALRLGVVGLINVQFALVDNDRLHVIEANPRASRTVPFVSKAIGVPLAKVACRLILGERLGDLHQVFLQSAHLIGGGR